MARNSNTALSSHLQSPFLLCTLINAHQDLPTDSNPQGLSQDSVVVGDGVALRHKGGGGCGEVESEIGRVGPLVAGIHANGKRRHA